MQLRPRTFLAPNASAMTMGGTLSYVVGRSKAVVIDPGSADASHVDAIAAGLEGAETVRILLTHDHPDHATGARQLARRVDARVFAVAAGTLRNGAAVPTDEGDLITIFTPGHAPDHAAFHWPAAEAVFCGDLMMGGSDTTVVAAPEGDLGAYLDSLERLRSLRPRTIYPAHGPEFTEPDAAIDRYVAHRRERERQVLAAIGDGVRDLEGITDRIYGEDLDAELRPLAVGAVQAYVAHLIATDRFPDDVT